MGGRGEVAGEAVDFNGYLTIAMEEGRSARIVIDADTRFGQPRVRGTRITVGDVLGYLAAGMTVEEVLTDFEELTVEDIRACLSFAAERERYVRVAA